MPTLRAKLQTLEPQGLEVYGRWLSIIAWFIEKCGRGGGDPKQLRKLLDILHLFVGTARNWLIRGRLRFCGCGVATRLATRLEAFGVGAACLPAAPYRLCTFSCSHTLISD